MNKNYDYKRLTPFKWFVLQNFPFIDEDFDAITNYQLFCKLGEEINKIIDSQNIVGEQAENLTNAFNNLKNYVDNYFDNLDVQDEINNKLNEMAEDGTLQEIISAYLNSKAIFGFDNVASMKEATNLIDGSYARTYGYYNVNDGGSSFYKIRKITNEDVVDESFILSLHDKTLIAELIINSEINILQLGAIKDGSEDNSSILQNAINYGIDNNIGNILIPDGNYLISNTITIKENKGITLKGTNRTGIGQNVKLGSTITTNCTPVFTFKTPVSNFVCENINFYDIVGSNLNTCFKVSTTDTDGYFARCRFEHLNFRNYKYAIDLIGGDNSGYVDGSIFNDIRFDTITYCIRAYHLECTTITNIVAEPFIKYIIYCYQSQTLEIANVLAHGIESRDNSEVAFVISGSSNTYGRNCYIHNVLFEDAKYILFNSTPNLILENIWYTNAKTALDKPIKIGRNGESEPVFNTFKNINIRYEDNTTINPIEFKSAREEFTFDDIKLVLDLGNYSGTIIEGVNPMPNKIPSSYLNKTNTSLIKGERKYYKNNVTYFEQDNAQNEATNPEGNAWVVGDIVDTFKKFGCGSTLGYVYNRFGEFEPLSTPVCANTKNRLNAYHPNIIGYPGFNTDSGKPCWWNGTAWVYSDGTTI